MEQGQSFDQSVDEFLEWARGASWAEISDRCAAMGVEVSWNPERARTPEGYYPIQGGIPYATFTDNTDFTTSSSVAGVSWLYFAQQGFNPFQPLQQR